MFEDDNAARRALQLLTEDSAPPVTTTVDEVLRRGRRRVFVQRASAFAGVAGVVAAIGVGAVLLRGQSGGVQVGDTTSAAPTTTSVPRSDGTGTQVLPTPLLPGGSKWAPVDMPPDADSGKNCVQMDQSPPDSDVALLPEKTVKNAFSTVVTETIGKPPVLVTSNWEGHSPKQDGAPRGFVSVEVPMDGGNGELQLEVGRFGGTAEAYADWSRMAYGNCEAPWRRVLADGTVLQLFPINDGDAKAPMQHLQIYRPDGREYIITSAGYSEADVNRGPDGSGRVEGGRGALPADAVTMGGIAERLVSNLG